MDFHVKSVIVYRLWVTAAGLITVLLLPLYLTKIQQGYYFTFLSLVSIQLFFELGLGQIVMQLISHESHVLIESSHCVYIGPCSVIKKLQKLTKFMFKWYSIAAIGFAFLSCSLGIYYFRDNGSLDYSEWILPWVATVCLTALNLWYSPKFSMLEGVGKVGSVAKLRIYQSVLGYSTTWLFLILGYGLWSVICIPLSAVIINSIWLKFNRLIWDFGNEVVINSKSDVEFSWKLDILPLQWRMAISWVSGYLIFNLITPVVFANNGDVEAGKVGLSMSVFAAILSIGMSWVNARMPVFGRLIASGERNKLNILFESSLILSTAFVALVSLGFLSSVYILDKLNLRLVDRLADISVLLCICINTIANCAIFAMASYMRAHKSEPMLLVSVVTAALTLSAIFFGSPYGTDVMFFVYTLITVAISLPWVYFIYKSYRCL